MIDLSYQLYSSREFPPLSETLKMLAETGYTQVEGFGGVYGDLSTLTANLKANGLTMTSGHFGIDMLEDEPDRVLEIAKAVGMEAIYCPHLAEELRPQTGPAWLEFGERLENAGAIYREAGLVFGWHNHDFEFQKCSDGSIPMEEIFKGGPSLSWEADIAWIVRGGGDPLDWLLRHGNRVSAIHIKDIAPDGDCIDEDGWADVGHGTMDWKSLLKKTQTSGVRFFVMEHDKPNDHQRFAKRSIAAVNSLMEA